MKENNYSPLMKLHLALMVVLLPMNLITGGMKIFSVLPVSTSQERIAVIMSVLANLINIAALIAGLKYLMKRYGKSAAKLYKAMLILTAISSVFYMCTAFGILNIGDSPERDQIGSGTNFIIAVSLMAVKVVLLLCLAFWADLGKRRTWIIFTIILVSDLAFGFLFSSPTSAAFNRITNVLSRLLMDGTIGLAIKGKYDDKDARGTV